MPVHGPTWPRGDAGLGVADGDLVRVESARATWTRARAPASPPSARGWCSPPSTTATGTGRAATAPTGGRAANELTSTEWDPVSKQPLYKVAAVRVTKLPGEEG